LHFLRIGWTISIDLAPLVLISLDKDGSGSIDADKFVSMMTMMGQSISKEQATQSIESVDSNGNGKMEFDEFLQFMGY